MGKTVKFKLELKLTMRQSKSNFLKQQEKQQEFFMRHTNVYSENSNELGYCDKTRNSTEHSRSEEVILL